MTSSAALHRILKFPCRSRTAVHWTRRRFIPVRSPIRRLLEVLLLVLVTSSLWFCLSYASPCRTLPPPVRLRGLPFRSHPCNATNVSWRLNTCMSPMQFWMLSGRTTSRVQSDDQPRLAESACSDCLRRTLLPDTSIVMTEHDAQGQDAWLIRIHGLSNSVAPSLCRMT